jgi:TonB-linked SusC/RagA family outer membrane protein
MKFVIGDTHSVFVRKVWMIMRITTLLILIAALHVSARTSAQKVTLSADNITFEEFFNQLKKQTGYSFLLKDGLIPADQKIAVHVNDVPLEQVLDQVLKPLSLSYKMDNKIVYILKAVPATLIPINNAFPPIDIHGQVTDSLGNPLAGASITVKGSRKGTQTDAKGNFILTNVNEKTTLIISYTGYSTRQFKINGSNDVTILLNKSNSPLDEVQIIAYGMVSKRLQTGNVSTVTSKAIEEQPVNNPLLALEGRVPGLFITQNTGVSGGGVTVRIQGQNSIVNGNDPLYVIDGVPYPSQMLSTTAFGGSILSGSGGPVLNGVPTGNGNPLNYINNDDIESIDVLKDADATAIYGSRAANGAILITTKKGKIGQTKVDINLQNGWGQVTRKLDLLNTQQYLQMRHEAFYNDALYDGANYFPPDPNYDYDLFVWDTTRYTNWQKTLIGGTSQYTNINTSVSGGTGNTQFYVGGTYNFETSVFPGNSSDKKGSLNFSLNSVSANQKFRIQLSGSYLIDNNTLISQDLTSTAIILAPNSPPLYNADGSLNWMPNSSGSSTWTNPLAYTLQPYQNNTNNLISNAVLSYLILPGLEIKSSFGYNKLQTNEFTAAPLISVKPERRPISARNAGYSYSTISSWIIEPQAEYKKNIGNGKLNVLVGTTINQNNNQGLLLYGSGYNSDLVMENIQSASTVAIGSTVNSVYKYNALFGRINYNWQDKYIVDLTARRDGSSRFGSQNQFHNFGSVGGAWIFSQERFIKNNLPIFSFGKLRGSYGSTGSDQIGDYQYLNLYSPTSVGIPYQNTSGLTVNGLPNPYLQWELTKKLQVGLDLGFLKDKVLLAVNYVLNRSSNQLLSYALPNFTGFGGVLQNFPATVQNTDLEFALNITIIKTKNFNWSTSINLTIPQNKLVAFPNLATSTYSYLVIGKPITIQRTYHFLGVDPGTGVYQFADSHGKPTSSPNYITDRNVFINTLPTFYGGIQNSFTYKGFELDFLFQFVKQIGVNYYFGNMPGTAFANQPVSVLNSWQKPGDVVPIQRYNADFSLYSPFSNATSSDAGYSDASYIRLKNLSLSWQLPDKWKQKVHLQNCSIYVHGQNLLTFTNYKGLDPETLSTNSLPPLRVLTLGLRVGL